MVRRCGVVRSESETWWRERELGSRIDSRGAPASARQATRSAHSDRASPYNNRHHTLRLGCVLCSVVTSLLQASIPLNMVSMSFYLHLGYVYHILFLLTKRTTEKKLAIPSC